MIPEESDEMRRLFSAKKIHLIHFVAPTTPRERQKRIAQKSQGFLYAVSVTGVTGARKALPSQTKAWLGSLRKGQKLPVCVGFGISGPDQIRVLWQNVDGFIVGSALIDVIRKNKSNQRISKMKTFISSLSKECDSYGR
jgi:tryptophan synthase alpha chain